MPVIAFTGLAPARRAGFSREINAKTPALRAAAKRDGPIRHFPQTLAGVVPGPCKTRHETKITRKQRASTPAKPGANGRGDAGDLWLSEGRAGGI
jgi:hypothetical protein